MKLSRDTALKIHVFFDQWLPPILRDCRWFMWPFMRILFRHQAPIYMNFKELAPTMSEVEYTQAYRLTSEVTIERATDLNHASLSKILENLQGEKVLEVGCGGGFLARKMSEKRRVTAVDIVITQTLRSENPNIVFQEANVEALPFPDASFDTVVCTHTLEHVRNLPQSIAELRRVTHSRLIIVVPKQRPYRYSFDLHLHFFPYLHSFLLVMGNHGANIVCEDADGDIFYREDRPHT